MFLSAEVTDFENFRPTSNVSEDEIALFKSNKKEVLNNLKDYLLVDKNSLDGNAIQQHLFPESKVDIFLSHSHGDENKVIELAILLERKGLQVFVDSCVWGNAFDLLKVIDDEYCINVGGNSYNYNQRNHSTAHVYMILNTALHRMIDNCEVFLFLGTPNSVSVKNGIKNQQFLQSPWIFSELKFVQHVRKNSSFDFKTQALLETSLERKQLVMDSVQVHYDKPELDYKINHTNLNTFLNEGQAEKIQTFNSLFSKLIKTQSTFL